VSVHILNIIADRLQLLQEDITEVRNMIYLIMLKKWG